MKDIAKRVFEVEIESLQHVVGLIDDSFTTVVEAILNSSGKVIVIGIGKSGLIGKKIAATLSSTGTPSFFLHPGDAFHGDLGIIGSEDAVILISYSGETDEVLKVIPFLKWNKNVIISITGNINSTIAKNSRHHLNIKITREACPLALAPTSSTTAALVMGDALAIALMESRKFQEEDFARFHPGGSLGRKLLTRVKDLMRTDNLPFIQTDAHFTDVLLRMSEGKLGMVIVGDKNHISGLITDGDLRRALLKNPDASKLSVEDMMTTNPVIVDGDEFVSQIEGLMMDKKITNVLVGNNRKIVGVYQIYNQ
ncbi:KpsF/GutQ family sugar-phosphate isomerase [Mucilaginibacter corticis]|uniref:KpsF/GutQ family sugar-phosphate isomerase n=1 Tax=Mucilaginibacter corticis TaxID=2597670 RepID=A0A556MHD2_9SPHI|nr:KpsF/GutQ family sugar-phosphate isomerase [Mucilaginibacter corticis]TSJ39235.1 KpsF/GutQ family sugar-phosphate isomerase [Mucilaginibacter corticis]